MARVLVPKKMRSDLLRRNANACCVCKVRHAGVNFHHIDGNASNTVESNVAVLCVRDHDVHHRSEEYRSDAKVNHVDLGRDVIAHKKSEWEAFVAEARKPKPAILATFAAYGTLDEVHSAKLAFQWADGRADGELVFERVYHLLDAPIAHWADWAIEEITWLGRGITLVLLDRPLSVDRCPSCSRATTRTIPSGFARRVTSPTWASSSQCAIYVNPNRASLAIRIEDDHGEALVAALHRCSSFLDFQSTTYHERLPILGRPSVRAQAKRIVEKIVRDWRPARTFFGTGPGAEPLLKERLSLPRCWETLDH